MEMIPIVKKLGDSDFQAKLLADPHRTLATANIKVPATTQVKVVRNSSDNMYIVLPTDYSTVATLDDEELLQIASGEAILIAAGIISVVTFSGVGLLAGIASGIATLVTEL